MVIICSSKSSPIQHVSIFGECLFVYLEYNVFISRSLPLQNVLIHSNMASFVFYDKIPNLKASKQQSTNHWVTMSTCKYYHDPYNTSLNSMLTIALVKPLGETQRENDCQPLCRKLHLNKRLGHSRSQLPPAQLLTH